MVGEPYINQTRKKFEQVGENTYRYYEYQIKIGSVDELINNQNGMWTLEGLSFVPELTEMYLIDNKDALLIEKLPEKKVEVEDIISEIWKPMVLYKDMTDQQSWVVADGKILLNSFKEHIVLPSKRDDFLNRVRKALEGLR